MILLLLLRAAGEGVQEGISELVLLLLVRVQLLGHKRGSRVVDLNTELCTRRQPR